MLKFCGTTFVETAVCFLLSVKDPIPCGLLLGVVYKVS